MEKVKKLKLKLDNLEKEIITQLTRDEQSNLKGGTGTFYCNGNTNQTCSNNNCLGSNNCGVATQDPKHNDCYYTRNCHTNTCGGGSKPTTTRYCTNNPWDC